MHAVIEKSPVGPSTARTASTGIIVFLLIAFGGAWLVEAVAWRLSLLNTSAGPSGQLVLLLAIAPAEFAPALGAFVVRRWVTREGFADAGLHLHLRRAWPYYLFAWLLPLPVVGVVVTLAQAVGVPTVKPGLPFPIVLAALAGALVTAPLFFGEEMGWRGYLQLRLWPGHPLLACALTGCVWGIWHYPLILIGYEGYEHAVLGLLIFPVFTVLQAIILGWLRLRTDSVWVAAVAHASANSVGGALTAYLYFGGGHFALTSYAGILAWIPLGLLCAWIGLTRHLTPKRGPDVSREAP